MPIDARSYIPGKPATNTRENIAWKNMKSRCRNPKNWMYSHYGGRGISVSPAFLTFHGFIEHMGNCPGGHSLDRIDNDGNYEPGNVRWATLTTQMRNRSDNVLLTAEGKTQTLAGWAEEKGMGISTLWRRLNHWPLDKALSTPVLSLSEISALGHVARWGNRI